MGDPVPDSKTPAMAAFGLVVVGLVIAAIQGLTHGSIAGGIIAAAGAIPGCFGMWKGIQQETQGTLAISVGAVLVSLAVGAVLIVLRVIHWLH
jgi:TRAP-type C4-dicarboxylate transport system permease small subunit